MARSHNASGPAKWGTPYPAAMNGGTCTISRTSTGRAPMTAKHPTAHRVARIR